MAYKLIRFMVFALCHAKHALADFKDLTHYGNAMSKFFLPTGQMPRLSGSILVNPAAADAADIAKVRTGSRFPVHEAPSSNQFDSTLHMGETLQEQNELTESYQHLRARTQPIPQADAKDAQYGFGFGSSMVLTASVGLVASIGIVAVRQYFAHEQQALDATMGFQASCPQRSRPIVALQPPDSRHEIASTTAMQPTVSRRAIALSTVGVLATAPAANAASSRTEGYKVQRPEREWQYVLSGQQYFILREGGTEMPNSSPLYKEKRAGTFRCAGCDTPLFTSQAKFESGTGWPSFATPLDAVEVTNSNPIVQSLLGTEVRCGTCGGHLGDVFSDGFLFPGTPAFTSGKRYCIDGAALVFQPSDGGELVVGEGVAKPPELPSWMQPPEPKLGNAY